MAYVSSSPPRVPPIQYATPIGTRWAKETAAAGGVGAFDLPTDPKLIGPWILGDCVGKGASGRVKIAKHRITGKLAAVKILPLAPLVNSRASLATQQAKSEKQRLGIDREITMMKLMNHPNIMRIYDVYEGAKELFLVLEYVKGGELFDFLVNRGRLPAAEALEYFKQIVYGLNYAHTFSIIHRDLKPENILIASLSPPLIKIADWGMAAFAPPSLQLETSCGSPHYASPEIVNGERYHGNATDIWSCGVILYALLTGRLPFDDKNIKTLLSKVKSGQYEMPDWIDPLAMDLISRMLVVDVSRRITIPEILSHPWLLSTSKSRKHNSRRMYKPPLPPSPSTLARPLEDPSLIDPELFSSLRIIWGRHTDPLGDSIKRDLCAPAGRGVHAKAFYFLLGRYRDESRRSRDSTTREAHDRVGTSAIDGIGSMRFNLGWELDLGATKQYEISNRRPLTAAPPAGSSYAPRPQISGLAPPFMSRTPTSGTSRARPPSPAGPRVQSWRNQQQPQRGEGSIIAPAPRSGSASRPVSTFGIGGPRPPAPRRGYTYSRPEQDIPVSNARQTWQRHGPRQGHVYHAPAPPYILQRPPTQSHRSSVDTAPSVVPPPPAVAETPDSSAEPIISAPVAPPVCRLNGLAKAQASPLLSPVPPTTYTHRPTINRAAPRSAREDKENQSVGDEGWSYVSAGECQGGLGLALGAKNGTGMGNVVYLSDNTAAPRRKKEKERKIKYSTFDLPPLKPKRSTLSLLASPIVLSTAVNAQPTTEFNGTASRLTSPVVGEFKGWFSNLFSWKGHSSHHPTPGTGVIYSPDGLEKTRREVGLLFERLGIAVEGSGFTFAEGSYNGDDDFGTGLTLRCKVDEATVDGAHMVLKPVRFRVEFS
ncbi:CAMK/CAMKL/GIN4 protein kinase, partial [Mycena rebaudengoi]